MIDDYEEMFEDDTTDDELECTSCGGAGWVWSVADESGRYGFDDDEPGTCPNCGGTGLRKDQKWF